MAVEAPQVSECWLEPLTDGVALLGRLPRPASGVAVVVLSGLALDERAAALGIGPLTAALHQRGIATWVVEQDTSLPRDRAPGDLVARWHHRARQATHAARATATSVVLVTIGAAALVVAAHDEPLPIDAAVLWAPALDGRRYVRGLRLLAAPAAGPDTTPGRATGAGTPDRLAVGEMEVSGGALATIAAHDARTCSAPLPMPLLVLEAARTRDPAALATLTERAPRVDACVSDDIDRWLGTSSEAAHAPWHDIETITDWIETTAVVRSDDADVQADTHVPPPPGPTTCRVPIGAPEHHSGTAVSDVAAPSAGASAPAEPRATASLVRFGTPSLAGVLTSAGDRAGAAVLLLSRSGPGGIFLDVARRLAGAGITSLRVDLTGFGASDRWPRQTWGEHYGRHGLADVRRATAWLGERGHERVVVVGFCATGWLAVRSVTLDAVSSAVALNAPLYLPAHGWATSDGRRDLRPWSRSVRIESVAERAMRRLPSTTSRLLHHAPRHGRRVTLLYDRDDPGLAHLDRIAGGDMPGVDVVTYADLGHALQGIDARDRMVVDLGDLLVERCSATAHASCRAPGDGAADGRSA